MDINKLKTFDQEVLLQELRRRERHITSSEPALEHVGESPSAGDGVGAPLGDDLEPELEPFDSRDIIAAVREQQEVIYGTDNRLDMYEVTDRAAQIDSDSVVALIQAARISDNGDGSSTLNGPTFGDEYRLCASEPFREQPTIAFCSGFLVDPSLIATAAHCLDESNLSTVRFVFGYEMSSATTAETRIDNDEIYSGRRIIGRQIGTQGTDWALIQLDRPVLNHPVVRLRRSGKIADSQGVHVIGHPSGIPKKYADGANVRDNTPSRFFTANLDTYGGNSGSAVFNTLTHQVEGILVRGETDFVRNGSCFVSNICPANGCRGEDCTRVSEFVQLVPRNEHDSIPFDPAQAAVTQIGNRWKIVVGRMLLLDFGNSQAEAQQALRVIQHYGLNSQCFVGRPHPSMEFYLVNGEAPTGAMPNEDCIPYNPDNVEVQFVRGRWKIVEGNHWIMDFDQKEDEARQALSYILRYGFRFICFVGRPHSSMTYFRR